MKTVILHVTIMMLLLVLLALNVVFAANAVSTEMISITATESISTTDGTKHLYRKGSSLQCKPVFTNISKKMLTPGVKKEILFWEAILLITGVGIISALIGVLFQAIRKYVYNDADTLDTTFDAGGTISISLTASTVVSHWTWGATLLMSSAVAAKFGISGPYYYAAGATIQIIIFAILSIQLKMKAPGSKTYLQVIYARFGKVAHLTYCIFAILTNVIIINLLMVAGIAVTTSLVEELSPDLTAILLGIIIGSYTLIGGLGATFYVSYFNTCLIFVLICWLVIEVFYNPSSNPDNPFGSNDALYRLVDCWPTTNLYANSEDSYLTFYSIGGLTFGIVNVIGSFGACFCDQAYWQKSIAAKPLHGVWGFILGALCWFAVPFTLATTIGLSYIGLNSAYGKTLLTDEDINAGLVVPFVAEAILGRNGAFVVLVMLLLVTMAAGSSEIIAVAAIIVYDIYQIHIYPFKPDFDHNKCILCEKWIKTSNNDNSKEGVQFCECKSMLHCMDCKEDDGNRSAVKGLVKPAFECTTHGQYRMYLEALLKYKNWWIVISTFLSVISSIITWYVKLNMTWIFYFYGIVVSNAVFPIAFSIMWTRATANGIVIGSITSFILAVISWLSYASTLPGGLYNFLENTGNEISMLIGNSVAFFGSALICVIISIVSKPKWTKEELKDEWEKTRKIDNPLKPWVENYKEELKLELSTQIHERPSLAIVERKFRQAWYTAIITTLILVGLMIIVWPLCMLFAVYVMDLQEFKVWTSISQSWVYLAALFIILAPLIQEILSICRQARSKTCKRNE